MNYCEDQFQPITEVNVHIESAWYYQPILSPTYNGNIVDGKTVFIYKSILHITKSQCALSPTEHGHKLSFCSSAFNRWLFLRDNIFKISMGSTVRYRVYQVAIIETGIKLIISCSKGHRAIKKHFFYYVQFYIIFVYWYILEI